MAAITRQVGATGQIIPVFIPDATVSTGVGLANIVASTATLSWKRSNMSAVSTQVLSTGTLGTWATSTFTQWSSTLALGWYDLSLPDGVFASGSTAGLHLYGAPSMAPVPILVELTATGFDNQRAISTQAATMPVVNTDKAGYGVSSLALYGVAALTTASGIISAGNAFLDVSVSSRLATAGYTAPDNTGISFISSTAQTLTAAERNSVADALLNRNVSGGSSTGRTVKQAYHVLRNKVDLSAGIVYDTDDSTSSWGFTVSTAASNPVVQIDPA